MTNVRRLLATAGIAQGPGAWQLICIVDNDPAVSRALEQADLPVWRANRQSRGGYWQALQEATDHWPEFTHLIGLANDLLPGQHWLRRAAAAYAAEFGSGPGLLGFNGDHHEVGHSCHFLIDRVLLNKFGGWPVWYDHNYGDTEMCQRAIELRLYAKAPWAVLYHDHPYFGGQDDPTYALGRREAERDLRLYNYRKAAGWPHVSQ